MMSIAQESDAVEVIAKELYGDLSQDILDKIVAAWWGNDFENDPLPNNINVSRIGAIMYARGIL